MKVGWITRTQDGNGGDDQDGLSGGGIFQVGLQLSFCISVSHSLNCINYSLSPLSAGGVMDKSSKRFQLVRDRWYAWQMIPGYIGERSIPYCSPIYVTRVDPLRTGRSVLRLGLVNVFYAEGVQDFVLKLKMLKRASDYLVAE